MLANRPPMGWNSWNTFGKDINEKLIMETADAIVEKGYKELGYEYVIIDDCWALRQRDKDGHLVPDPEKFPHGMKYIADYIHSKGLKFGMYSCAGILTCARFPSSYGHEYEDAMTFAQWEIDYLKYDFCNFPACGNSKNAYLTMSMALRSCGREILLAACNWGHYESWNWMRSIGAHTYRSTGDIFDNFNSFKDIILKQENNFSMSGPGCYNDIDMLTVGMYGKGLVGMEECVCTDEEYLMQFSLWCLYSAPLIMGGDIRKIDGYCKELMQNKELISINQDAECRPPIMIEAPGGNRILFKILSDNEYVLAFYNYSDSKTHLTIPFVDLGIPYTSGKGLDMHDVVTGEKLGVIRDFYSAETKEHTCHILRGKLIDV